MAASASSCPLSSPSSNRFCKPDAISFDHVMFSGCCSRTCSCRTAYQSNATRGWESRLRTTLQRSQSAVVQPSSICCAICDNRLVVSLKLMTQNPQPRTRAGGLLLHISTCLLASDTPCWVLRCLTKVFLRAHFSFFS